MKVYSAQDQRVLSSIQENERYFVKRKFITMKYGEVAKVMFNAYDWFVEQMEAKISKPLGAQYPVWHALDARFLYLDADTHLIELAVPKSEILLFDNHGWERVLQMNYVGVDKGDEEAFDDNLRRKGIMTGSKVFLTPHYPLERQLIIKSWSRIFDITESKAIRGATWKIEKSWLMDKEQ